MRIMLFVFIMFISKISCAYEISPVYQFLESTGDKSSATYTLKNTDSKQVLVEALVFSVAFIDGEEVLTEAEDDFILMPPQAKIEKGHSQNFRVRYLANGVLDKTKSFRVIFKQIKIPNPSENKNEVEMLINFSTLVFVSPPNSEPVPSATIDGDMLKIKNHGTKFLDMSNLKFTFLSQSDKETVEWKDLSRNSSLYLMPDVEKQLELSEKFASAKSVELIYLPK